MLNCFISLNCLALTALARNKKNISLYRASSFGVFLQVHVQSYSSVRPCLIDRTNL